MYNESSNDSMYFIKIEMRAVSQVHNVTTDVDKRDNILDTDLKT